MLYMTNSLVNKISLKEYFYMFSVVEDTPIQKHLDEFNSITIDLENWEVKTEYEDKVILLVVLLPASHKNF